MAWKEYLPKPGPRPKRPGKPVGVSNPVYTEQVRFRVTPEELIQLHAFAGRRGIKLSAAVRFLMKKGFEVV